MPINVPKRPDDLFETASVMEWINKANKLISAGRPHTNSVGRNKDANLRNVIMLNLIYICVCFRVLQSVVW